MEEFIQVLTTTNNKDEAVKIARKVVEKRLAGCSQVLGPIKSFYWWKKRIEETEEWLCLIKSKSNLYGELEREIKGIHTYETPEIIVTPITKGNREYFKWLTGQLPHS